MKFSLIVEEFDLDSRGTIALNKKDFCSKECAIDFLFDEFELEGLDIQNEQIINLSECSITVVESDEDNNCEYGCITN